MRLKKIMPEDIQSNTFKTISGDWMLLTAGDIDSFNPMTVSWGGLGVLWRKNVATVYVRHQRYTYDFLEKSDHFTLSVYPENMRDKLALCGSKSGRDINKVEACDFTPVCAQDGGVYFEGAKLVLVCRKIYYNDFDKNNIPEEIMEKFYSGNYAGDYHRMYVGEIVEALSE